MTIEIPQQSPMGEDQPDPMAPIEELLSTTLFPDDLTQEPEHLNNQYAEQLRQLFCPLLVKLVMEKKKDPAAFIDQQSIIEQLLIESPEVFADDPTIADKLRKLYIEGSPSIDWRREALKIIFEEDHPLKLLSRLTTASLSADLQELLTGYEM